MTEMTKISLIVLLALFVSNQGSAEEASSSASFWDGPYLGAAIGFSHGMSDPRVMAKENGYFITTDPGQINPEGSRNIDETNVSGNLFLGLNRQLGHIVYGIEADLSLTDYDEQYQSGNRAYLTIPTSTFSVTTNIRSHWATSLRPRLGYAHGKSLFFVSGGPALREFNYDFTFTDTFSPEHAQASKNEWEFGWIAGLGYEYKFYGDLALKAEYFYSSYTDIVDTDSKLRLTPSDGFTHNLDFEDHSFRIGLSKSF